MSNWIKHIKAVRAAHKGMSYKDAMKIAGKSYKSSGPSHKKHHKKTGRHTRKGCKGRKHRGGGEAGAVDPAEGTPAQEADTTAPPAEGTPGASADPQAHQAGGKRKRRKRGKTRKRKCKKKCKRKCKRKCKSKKR